MNENDNAALIRAHLDWLTLKGRAPNTIAGRRHILHRCAAALPVPLADASEADLTAWRASLSSLADVSVISAVSHVRGLYAWAHAAGILAADPAARIPVPPMPDWQPHPMSDDDLQRALDGAPPRIRTWLVLGASGLRCCEIALLRRNCVREADTPPHIVIRRDATKGRRHGRTVYLSGWAAAELAAAGLPAVGWCFPRLDGAPGPVSAHLVSNLANDYLHRAGVTGTFHWLRHSFATRLLDQCGDLAIVKDQLGHKSVSTTTVYTKIGEARAAAAVAAMPVPGVLRHAS